MSVETASAHTESSSPEGMRTEKFCLGSLTMKNCRVYWNTVDVCLSYGEYRVIRFLVKKPGLNRTYRDIYDLIQSPGFIAGNGDMGNANVRSMLKRIRKKFSVIDPTFDQIKNFSGFGYRWGDSRIPADDSPFAEGKIIHGSLTVYPAISEVYWKGAYIDLTYKEVKLISALVLGSNMTYRQINDVLYGEGFLTGNGPNGYKVNVRSYVRRMNNTFRITDPSFDAIHNSEGYGYIWRE